MAVNPNFTNANSFTSFFGGGGGGGGSNFPNGISVGSNQLGIAQGNVGTEQVVYTSGSNGINCGFLAGQTWAGDIATSYVNTTSTTIGCITGDLSKYSQLASCDTTKMGSPNWTLPNVGQMSGTKNTTTSNDAYNPFTFTLRPDQAVKNGQVFGQFTWDAVDTGANYALTIGATSSNALITSIWPGYISMPLTLTGALIDIASDNETFLHMDGKAGALGSISTGTPFLSGSNLFSSITAPTGPTANMQALLSTLASVYPACFV